MPDQTKFKHITVNADDEEVIIAGVTSDASSTLDQSINTDHVSFDDNSSDDSSLQHHTSKTDIEDQRESKTSKQQKDAEYHETTLDDIESSRMGTTQKVILVLAILAVIAFIVYYVFFL